MDRDDIAELASNDQSVTSEGANSSGSSPTAKEKIFDKWQFRIGKTTGEKAKEIARDGGTRDRHGNETDRGVGRRRIPENTESQEVDLGGEVYEKFSNHISEKVGKLAELAKRPAPAGSGFDNYMDYILASGLASGAERHLLETCTDTLRDNNNRPIYTLNKEKVDAFLSTVEGYNYTFVDMEQTAALTEMGLNMQAMMLPESERRQLYQRMDAMFGKGGRVMDALHWANHQLPENIYRFFHATRFRFDAQDGPDRLDSIHAMQGLPPIDRDYIFSTMGINVDAFDPVTSHRRGDSEIAEALDSDQALITASLALNGRRVFLEKLGINLDKTYTAEQVIMGGYDHLSMAPTLYNQQLLDGYEEQYEAMEATLGRALNDTERRSVFNHVRLQIKNEALENYIRIAESKTTAGQESKDLDAKIAERADPAKRQELINKRRTINEKDRAEALIRKDEVGAARLELLTPLENATRRVEELEAKIIRRSQLPLSGDIDSSLQARIDTLKKTADTGLDALIAERNKLLGERSTEKGKVRGEGLGVLTEYSKKVKASVRGGVIAIPEGEGASSAPDVSPIINSGNQSIEEDFGPRIQDLNVEIERINGEIQVLTTEQNSYRDAQSERDKAIDAVARLKKDELQNSANRLTDLQGLGIVTDDEIRNLPMPELMQRIRGTGLTDENDILEIASFAKSELSGQDHEANHHPFHNELNALAGISGLGIDDQDILLRTPRELARAINASTLGWSPEQVTENILAARDLVTKRLATRYSSRLAGESAYWEGRSTPDSEEQQDLTREIDREATQLRIAREILTPEKREEIYGRAHDIMNPQNQDLRDRLVNRTVIAPDAPNYSDEEKNKGLSTGYVEWLRTLYPEYHGKTNEAALFNALHESLPPAELARILNESLVLGLRGRRITIDNALREVQRGLTPPARLNRAIFDQAFIGIVESIRRRAQSL